MHSTLLFTRVAATLGLSTLKPNHIDACAIAVDRDVQVEPRHDEALGMVSLCVGVARIPAHRAAVTQRAALAANLRPADLGGAHFALHPGRSELLLCAALEDPGSDPAPVCAAVARMVALCRHWRAVFA
ncbi:MAG TPA: type III secretion system chaperone [Ramlibacter sp.]|nr:type III secretion system chaperone [Ramlibacter sp.]